MKNYKKLLGCCLISTTFCFNVYSQQVEGFVHQQSEEAGYVWPDDRLVLDKLEKWQDQKFGVLFHWGLYSVPGIVESWSICSEDVDWISRKNGMPYDEYKKWYFGLKDQLNPVHFNPEQWADVMQDAGIKYMISPLNIMTVSVPLTLNIQISPLHMEPLKTIHAKTWLIMYLMHSEKKAS